MHSGGDLAPSLGGTEQNFADQDDVFSEKISIFAAKISDDLFLVIDQVFSNFRIFILLDVVLHDPSYITLSSQEKPFFLLFSYFRAHPTTLLLKILGGRMHGPSPTSNFGGPSPQSP